MYAIFCIIFAPIVLLAGVKMASDMNKPRKRCRKPRKFRGW